jgi:hypothetical protein
VPGAPGSSTWSIPEVVHALSVLAHFHGLASIALGCGILAEADDVYLDGESQACKSPMAKQDSSEVNLGSGWMEEKWKTAWILPKSSDELCPAGGFDGYRLMFVSVIIQASIS